MLQKTCNFTLRHKDTLRWLQQQRDPHKAVVSR